MLFCNSFFDCLPDFANFRESSTDISIKNTTQQRFVFGGSHLRPLAFINMGKMGSGIGHQPKAKSNSSRRVCGLQHQTVFGGKPCNKMQRRRQREQARRRAGIGVLKVDGVIVGKKKAATIAQSPGQGSFLQPRDHHAKAALLAKFQASSLTDEYIDSQNKTNNHIFYCADGTGHIDGLPTTSTVKPVDSLFIVDSTTGFQYPLDGGEFDDVFLVPREHVIKEEYQPDHAKLLHALTELSKRKPEKGFKCGKNRIVAFQHGSNNRYLTPGIFPLWTSSGVDVRGVGDLEHSDHDAIFKYVKKCENLALSYMGKEMKRGFSHAKQAFPYETFPGFKKGQKTHMFSAIATSLNVCLNSHKDTDAVYSVVTNLEANPEKIQAWWRNHLLFYIPYSWVCCGTSTRRHTIFQCHNISQCVLALWSYEEHLVHLTVHQECSCGRKRQFIALNKWADHGDWSP